MGIMVYIYIYIFFFSFLITGNAGFISSAVVTLPPHLDLYCISAPKLLIPGLGFRV